MGESNRELNRLAPEQVKERALVHHQAGMNGAQAVLQALMDGQVIEDMPHLIQMTSTWKGGVGGDTCSAFAAATMAIGLLEEKQGESMQAFKAWFTENFGAINCPTITAQAGGRPSKTQKDYCDLLAARTAEYIANIKQNKE